VKWLLALCSCWLGHWCLGQNLVPNSGFEEFNRCPTSFSTDPKHFGPNQWNSPTIGTPDYFNKCSIGENGVPRNWAGVSYAHSGVGYSGIYAWNNKTGNYREYIQCKLKEPLKNGASYYIEFYYRISSYSVYAIDRIGLALSDSAVWVRRDNCLEITPVFSEKKKLETLTNGWQRASAQITARGGEQFLIIGNFSDNESTENTKIDYREGKSPMLGGSAYYYIDDILVSPIDDAPVIDSVSLDSQPAIQPNEVYILKHIHFPFNSYELLPSSFQELDALIAILKKNPQWKVNLSGHTDDQGSDDYNLALSANRAKSVGNYLLQNGVQGDRILTQGFGKQKPLHNGNDEQARMLNRRVEAKFID